MSRKPSVFNSPSGKSVTPSIALTIAGFDPSSGAGITADLKVLAAHGLYGVAAITALTVQSTTGVRRVEPVPGRTLRDTLDCLTEDAPPTGVKIGMLATAENVRVVAGWLGRAGIPRERVVLDPVLRSSSGTDLLDVEGLAAMRTDLLGAVGWISPNLDELGLLTDKPVGRRDDVPRLAGCLASLAPGLNVVVTGGHLDAPDDFLLMSTGDTHWFPGCRVETPSTHGTGCVFSSALLGRLLIGEPPATAVQSAKDFVTRALQTAVPVGRGKGPALLFGDRILD